MSLTNVNLKIVNITECVVSEIDFKNKTNREKWEIYDVLSQSYTSLLNERNNLFSELKKSEQKNSILFDEIKKYQHNEQYLNDKINELNEENKKLREEITNIEPKNV